MYRLTNTDIVIRNADGAAIPNDSENTDRQDYTAWLAEGNTPEAVAEQTDEEKIAAIRSEIADREREKMYPNGIRVFVMASMEKETAALFPGYPSVQIKTYLRSKNPGYRYISDLHAWVATKEADIVALGGAV